MEFTTAIAFPILTMAIGLILEYWVVQPLRNNSLTHTKDSDSKKQIGPINKFVNLLIPLKSSYSKIIVGFLFFIFTFVYYFYTYPSYLKNYQQFFYEISTFNNNYYNGFDSIREKITVMVPKYIQSGQETEINIQVENQSSVALDDVYIRVESTYTRLSREIPFTANSTPIETTFRNIAPNTQKYTTITYTPPSNLLDGDEVKLTFYQDETDLARSSYQYNNPIIIVNRSKAFLLSFFENILFTYWAYFFLLLTVIASTTIGLLELNPPDEPIASMSGLLYLCRALVRTSVLLLLILEISAGLLIGYWHDYTVVIFTWALATYIPFRAIIANLNKFVSNKKVTKHIKGKTDKRSPPINSSVKGGRRAN